MRYVRYLCILLFVAVVMIIAMANRDIVTVTLMPAAFATELGFTTNPSQDMPLYLVIFAGIIIGLALGYAAEYIREAKFRSEVKNKGREVRRLQRENRKLRSEQERNQGDEILAILDEQR